MDDVWKVYIGWSVGFLSYGIGAKYFDFGLIGSSIFTYLSLFFSVGLFNVVDGLLKKIKGDKDRRS